MAIIEIAQLDIDVTRLDASVTRAREDIDQLTRSIQSLNRVQGTSIRRVEALQESLSDLQRSYNSNLSVLSRLSQVENNASRISAENRQAISDLVRENRNLNRERTRTQTELERLRRSEERRRQGLQATEGSINALRRANRELRQARNEVNTQTEEGTRRIRQLNDQINRNDRLIRENSESLARQRLNVGNYASAWQGASGVLSRIGSVLGVTIGLVGGLGLALRNAAVRVVDYNRVLTDLRAISGATAEQLQELETVIQSTSSVSTRSAIQVAELSRELIRLGFSIEQVTSLLPAVNNFSIALGVTAGESAEFLGATIRAFGATANEVDRFADVLSASTTRSSLNFERLRESLSFVAPVARTVGQTIEGLTAQLSVLADAGIRASTTGTGLRQIYIRLARQNLTLNQALNQINNSQNRLTEAQRLFGVEASTVAIVLADNIERTAELDQQYQNVQGTLERLTDVQLTSLTSRISLLDSAWESFVLSIEDGEGNLSTFFRNAIDGATNLINTLRTLTQDESQTNRETINRERIQAERDINQLIRERITIENQQRQQRGEIILQGEELDRFTFEQTTSTALGFYEQQQDLIDVTSSNLQDLRDEYDLLTQTVQSNPFNSGDALVQLRDLEQAIDGQNNALNIYQGRLAGAQSVLDSLSETTTVVTKNTPKLTTNIEALQDSISLISLERLSDALQNFSTETGETLNSVFAGLQEDINRTIDAEEQNRLNDLRDRFLDQINTMEASGASELEILQQQAENERDLLLENDELTFAERERIKLNFTERERKIDEQRIQQQLRTFQATSNLLTALSSLMQNQSLQQKSFQSVASLLDTYGAITKALNDPTIPNTFARIAAAVAIGIQGFQRVRQINAVEVPTFAKGGIIDGKGTMIQGKSHAQGGEPIFVGNQYVGEAESGEVIGILNRNASADFMKYNNSFLNGSNPNKSNYFQAGGIVSQPRESLNLFQFQRLIDNTLDRTMIVNNVPDTIDVSNQIQAINVDGTI